MNNTLTGFKRYLAACIVFLLGILLALIAVRVPVISTKAADDDVHFTEPAASSLSVTNPQFDESSGSFPSTPSGWTGSDLTGASSNVVAGVISLSADSYNSANKNSDGTYEDVYRLTRYPEYSSRANIPQTPFGTSEYPNTNKNVLMINTVDSTTAYGYASASLTLSAASYYRMSAYVKTGNFPTDTGAAIKITGLDEELAFKNINTVRNLPKDTDGNPVLTKDNLFGFKKYTFYVATQLSSSSEITISLQVGDYESDEENELYTYSPAKGYAFFDNVVAEQIPANTYFLDKETYNNPDHKDRDYYLFKDFTEGAEYLTDNSASFKALYTGEDIGEANDIGSFENGMEGWTRINDLEGLTATNFVSGVYNTHGSYDDSNVYGLKKEYVSPIGDREGNANILVLASKNDSKVAAGFRSPAYTILRNTYYRLSYFVNTEGVSGGSGAASVIRGTNGVADNDNKLASYATGLAGDSANALGYGWKQYSYYIRGSYLKDYEISLELWLGQPDSLSSGVAMFDEIKLEKITPAVYSSDCATGTIVTFDPTFQSTGIENGRFYEVGQYEEYAYPLVPASWTLKTPSDAGVTGFSSQSVKNTDEVVSGIISTESEHFEANRGSYNNVANPAPSTVGNMLMISSTKETAVGYRSPSVSVTANSRYIMTVDLVTEGLTGYGANLMLLSGNDVIATIENIKRSGTYTFYLEGGLSDQSVNLDIWLGFIDRENNRTKLASGSVFVDKVTFNSTEDEDAFNAAKADYRNKKSANFKNFNFAVYSFDSFDLDAYDVYSNDVIRPAYDFTLSNQGTNTSVVYGIFDYTSLPEYPTLQNEIPDYFSNGKEPVNNGVLYLRNVSRGYSAITMRNTLSLSATSYYRLSVSIKVDLPDNMLNDENAVGAGISLTNTDYAFENIKSTVLKTKYGDIVDKEAYRTYNFYIKTGSDGLNANLTFSLGSGAYPNRYTLGRLYVNEITLSSVGNSEFDDMVSALDKNSEDYDEELAAYNAAADFGADDEDADSEDGDTNGDEEDEEKPTGEIAWWLIPSILFAIAIVIAVVGTLIRRILDRRAEKKEVKVKNSYDRSATLHKIHNAKESGEKLETATASDDYDEFDDTLPVAKTKTVEPAVEEEPEEVEEEQTDSYDEFDDEFDRSEETETEESSEVGTEESSSEEATAEGASAADGEAKPAEPAKEKAKPAPKAAKSEKPKAEKKPVAKPAPKSSDFSDDFED